MYANILYVHLYIYIYDMFYKEIHISYHYILNRCILYVQTYSEISRPEPNWAQIWAHPEHRVQGSFPF